MRTLHKIGLAAALLASAAIGPATVFASQNDESNRPRQERPDRPASPDRGNQPDRGAQPDMGNPGGGGDRGDRGQNMNRGGGNGPPANFRGQRPERSFRSAPPGFRGTTSPRAQMRAGRAQGQATFHGRSFNQFTRSDRAAWRHGGWRHTRHNGHFGWWWNVGGLWFFYPQPIYPFPTSIGFYYDDYPNDYYWYWCDDPPGYYPYVQECYYDWVPVPPQY